MQKRTITPEDLFNLKVVSDPQVSPDGGLVIFDVKTIDREKNCYRSQLYLAEVESGEVCQFTYGEGSDVQPRWSPDGKSIAFIRTTEKDTQVWIIPITGGEARRITNLPEGGIGAFVWSPLGYKLLFEFRPTHEDWTREAVETRQKAGLSDPPRLITRFRYRQEGEGFLDTHQHLWMCDIQNGETSQLTEGNWDDRDPVWSPDGAWVALISNRSDDPEIKPYLEDIWRVHLAKGNLEKIPTPPGYKWGLSWSPNGEEIAYIGSETQADPWGARNDRLWVVPVNGGRASNARCLGAALDRIAENATLYDVRGSGNQNPVWAPDSQQIFFLASDRGSCRLYVSGHSTQLEVVVGGEMDIAGFSADALTKRFAVLLSRPSQPTEISIFDAGSSARILNPLSRINTPFLDEVDLSEPEEIRYASFDGMEIQGWLLKPPQFDPGRKYPLVLYIHGGPAAQYGQTFFHELQVLAGKGYLVLYTNPRGSLGREESFATCIEGEWGDLDYRDLMAAVDHVVDLNFVDAERMAVAGGSYGGFMVVWIVGNTPRFKCAIAERGVYNRHSAFGTSDFPPMPDGYWPGNAWDRPEQLWQQSPLRFAENIHTPLLIIHSEGDLRCPISQAEQLYSALGRLKRKVQFVRYPPNTSHGLSRSGPPDLRVDRLARILAWLDEHLN